MRTVIKHICRISPDKKNVYMECQASSYNLACLSGFAFLATLVVLPYSIINPFIVLYESQTIEALEVLSAYSREST